jgi:hypothetical protein
MGRRVKEFIEVYDYQPLEALIDKLSEIRPSLPGDAQPVVTMRGDDVFGRVLSISYWRPQTPEEAASDARCAKRLYQARATEQPAPMLRLRSIARHV